MRLLLTTLSIMFMAAQAFAQPFHVRPQFDSTDFNDSSNTISLKPPSFPVTVSNAGTRQGDFRILNLGSDFSTTISNACLDGTNDGTLCTTNSDCTGSGVCTSAGAEDLSLSSQVYTQGTTIAATDLPVQAVRTDASRTADASIVLDWGAGSLEIPNSTAANDTTTGRISFDTDATPPMITVGDGTNALPTRTCFAQSLSNQSTGVSPNGVFRCSLNGDSDCAGGAQDNRYSIFPMAVIVTGLSCQIHRDLKALGSDAANPETQLYKLQSASCTTSSDGGTLSCTWSDLTGATCTATGTSGFTDIGCSASFSASVAANTRIQLVMDGNNIASGTILGCTTLICADATW